MHERMRDCEYLFFYLADTHKIASLSYTMPYKFLGIWLRATQLSTVYGNVWCDVVFCLFFKLDVGVLCSFYIDDCRDERMLMVCHLQRDKHQDPTPSQLHVYLTLRPCVTSHAAAATQRGTVTIEGYRFLAVVTLTGRSYRLSRLRELVIGYTISTVHCVRYDQQSTLL